MIVIRPIVLGGAMLVSLAVVAGSAADPDDGSMRMPDRMRQELVDWAIHFSDLPRPASPPPAVMALGSEAFARRVCVGDGTPCDNVLAAYDVARNEVIHRASLDLAKPWDRSFVVHELVHWLQVHKAATVPAWGAAEREARAASDARPDGSARESRAECEARRAAEREAYAVQNRYLRHYHSGRRAGGVLMMMHCR